MTAAARIAAGLSSALLGSMVAFPVVVVRSFFTWLPTEDCEVVSSPPFIALLALGFAFAPKMYLSTFATCSVLHVNFPDVQTRQ